MGGRENTCCEECYLRLISAMLANRVEDTVGMNDLLPWLLRPKFNTSSENTQIRFWNIMQPSTYLICIFTVILMHVPKFGNVQDNTLQNFGLES